VKSVVNSLKDQAPKIVPASEPLAFPLSLFYVAGVNSRAAAALLLVVLCLAPAQAQRGGGRRFRRGSYEIVNPEQIREQEEMEKALTPGFREDTFTFARLKFDTDRGYGLGWGRSWDDDTPDADLTLTYRMYQFTSLKVRPGLNFIDITTKDLEKYPFVYVAAAGRMALDEDQAEALRRYLLNGGFLMVDDFWGDDQWYHFRDQMKRVFPQREPVELPLSDRIFQNVFQFKKLPQIPSVGAFLNYRISYDPGPSYAEKGHDPHFYGIYDDAQRMMVLICHNNHFGDGWEHETDDQSYFNTFSEPMGYPMFINIAAYATSH
jgi:hypothetical protein